MRKGYVTMVLRILAADQEFMCKEICSKLLLRLKIAGIITKTIYQHV
jgi:hypothetical protein